MYVLGLTYPVDVTWPMDSERRVLHIIGQQLSTEIRWLGLRACVGPPLVTLSAHSA